MLRAAVIRGSLLTMMVAVAPVAQATVVIDPDVGWEGYFLWENGVGLIDGISETPYYYYVPHDTWPREHKDWSITLSESSVIPYIEVWDNYDVPGDVYELLIDGISVTPNRAYPVDASPHDFFYWEYDNVPLGAGTHTIVINVTATGGPYIHYGSGHALFAPASPAIPAPGAILSVVLGTGLVGCLRRRGTL